MPSEQQDENEREQQLDAIIAEYHRLPQTINGADQEAFILRYPDFSAELKEYFSNERLFILEGDSTLRESMPRPTFPDVPPPGQSAPNQVVRYFGEYEILKKLGEGGMGVVYQARQKKLNRIVALKMIRSGELANAIDISRFEAEAKAAAKLSHPGIVAVHEVGIHNGYHFYTMDFVEGGNLSRLHVDKFRLVPPRHAALLVKQMAESMHYAHQQGIIHRDLKPANILLTVEGVPKITDFGLAKRFRMGDESQDSTMTETGQVLGTAAYMSPEQAAGKPRLAGPSSDVYSLGAVLYALLTGQAPFVGMTPTETRLQVLKNEPISPRKHNPSVPRDLETICLKCLEKEPHKRYGTAQLLASDLQLFLERKPVKARPVSSLERSWRWCRRNPLLCAIATLAILLVIGLPVTLLLQVTSAVNGIQDSRGGAALQDMIAHLNRYPSHLVTAVLNSRFEDENTPHRKWNLAMALAANGIAKSEYLISKAGAVKGNETSVVFTALNIDREASLKLLRSANNASTGINDWRRKSQLAILAMYFGEPMIAVDMCQIANRPDPAQRTIFIDELPRWQVSTKSLIEIAKISDDAGFCSAVIMGIGSTPPESLSPAERLAWTTLAKDWHIAKPDGVTHSATGWLLRQWKSPPPDISSVISDKLHEKNWYVNSQMQTFVRIPGVPFSDSSRSTREQIHSQSFWVADREVSVGQFQRFVSDAKYPADLKPKNWGGAVKQLSPTPDHPVQNVNWEDAVLYCNWLSGVEGLDPAYITTGQKAYWQAIESSGGYRLPHEFEWHHVCRAGTKTPWSSGDDEELLRGYSLYNGDLPEACGQRFPNGWGVFDMHGNVTELCGIAFLTSRFLGGEYSASPSSQRPDYAARFSGSDRIWHSGFRLVRNFGKNSDTIPPSEVSEAGGYATRNVVNLKSRSLIASGRSLTGVQHSLNGDLAVVCGFDGYARLFNLAKLEDARVFLGHEKAVWSVALSPDGKTLVTGSEDNTLRFWDVTSGNELDRFNAQGIFSSVQFSADGTQVFATNWDGTVRVWRPSSGKLGNPREFRFAISTLDLALLPEQKAFVVGNTLGQVLLCDAETGVIKKSFKGRTGQAHTGWVHSVEVIDGGGQILSASHDTRIRLWNVESEEGERSYSGHFGDVHEVRLLPDGKRFVSCGSDGILRLWDILSQKLLAAGSGGGAYRGLSIAPDGKTCLTAGLDGSLLEWVLPPLDESMSDSSESISATMLKDDAFQKDYNQKTEISLRPIDVLANYDWVSGEILYGIEWAPPDGSVFIVRHRMSDDDLRRHEADALQNGYRRVRVSTVNINGVKTHIGLWTKAGAASQP